MYREFVAIIHARSAATPLGAWVLIALIVWVGMMLPSDSWGQAAVPFTAARPVAASDAQTARLMLADARQWSQRGWTDGAIRLAHQAAAMRIDWTAEEDSPNRLLADLGVIEKASFQQAGRPEATAVKAAAPTTPAKVPEPIEPTRLPTPSVAAATQPIAAAPRLQQPLMVYAPYPWPTPQASPAPPPSNHAEISPPPIDKEGPSMWTFFAGTMAGLGLFAALTLVSTHQLNLGPIAIRLALNSGKEANSESSTSPRVASQSVRRPMRRRSLIGKGHPMQSKGQTRSHSKCLKRM